MQSKIKNPILLYQEQNTQSDSRNFQSSKSRSRLRDNFQIKENKMNGSNTNRNASQINLFSHSRTYTMTDEQQRIKRNYSPLYQRSTKESGLFQKGVKKTGMNINLQSRIDLTAKAEHKEFSSKSPIGNQKVRKRDISPGAISRRDPNKQEENLLELGLKPLLETGRSIKKVRDPNIEYFNNDLILNDNKTQKKLIKKDPNIQSEDTADYVVKALSTHTANKVKEVHLKFYKKENINSKENFINFTNNKEDNQEGNKNQGIVKQHKRHFLQVNTRPIKSNIEVKQNGISLKQNVQEEGKSKHSIKLFNHDFYKKESRMPKKQDALNIPQTSRQLKKTKDEEYATMRTARVDNFGNREIKTLQKEFQNKKQNIKKNTTNNQFNRMALLRKKFL